MTRDPLFDRLAAMWRERDPMPPDLPGRVLARLVTDGIETEYERLRDGAPAAADDENAAENTAEDAAEDISDDTAEDRA